jgi:oxygen-dependent protoporphyrinogen oxidase
VKLPGRGQLFSDMLWTVLSEPMFKDAYKSLLEFNRQPRGPEVEDESVGAFLSRRLGSTELVNNIASAGLHGIYAGDIWQLSAKSLMPGLWYQEVVFGSLSVAFASALRDGKAPMLQADALLRDEMMNKLALSKNVETPLIDQMRQASVYTFKSGIGALTDALEKDLRENPKVQFKMGTEVTAVTYAEHLDGVSVSINPSITSTLLTMSD